MAKHPQRSNPACSAITARSVSRCAEGRRHFPCWRNADAVRRATWCAIPPPHPPGTQGPARGAGAPVHARFAGRPRQDPLRFRARRAHDGRADRPRGSHRQRRVALANQATRAQVMAYDDAVGRRDGAVRREIRRYRAYAGHRLLGAVCGSARAAHRHTSACSRWCPKAAWRHVRRIEAITGDNALAWVQDQNALLQRPWRAAMLTNELPERIARCRNSSRRSRKNSNRRGPSWPPAPATT